MNCKRCGAPINAGDLFCKGCGAPIEKEEPAQSVSASEQSPFGPIMPSASLSQPSAINPSMVAPSQTSAPSMIPNINQAESIPETSQEPKKKGKGLLYILLVIVVLAIAGAAFYFGMTWNKEEEPVEEVVENYKVYYSNFAFEIPINYTYKTDELGRLCIYNEDDTAAFIFTIKEGNFASVVAKKAALKKNMENNGLTCSSLESENIGGKEYLVTEVLESGVKYIATFAELNSQNVIISIISDVSNEYNHSLLTEANDIIKTATYVGTSTNAKVEMSTDLGSFIEE